MLKERMTPEEIAHLTGYSRQTINKWVRKEGWQTSPRPGVQGGKARLVHVNEQMQHYGSDFTVRAPIAFNRLGQTHQPQKAISQQIGE